MRFSYLKIKSVFYNVSLFSFSFFFKIFLKAKKENAFDNVSIFFFYKNIPRFILILKINFFISHFSILYSFLSFFCRTHKAYPKTGLSVVLNSALLFLFVITKMINDIKVVSNDIVNNLVLLLLGTSPL